MSSAPSLSSGASLWCRISLEAITFLLWHGGSMQLQCLSLSGCFYWREILHNACETDTVAGTQMGWYVSERESEGEKTWGDKPSPTTHSQHDTCRQIICRTCIELVFLVHFIHSFAFIIQLSVLCLYLKYVFSHIFLTFCTVATLFGLQYTRWQKTTA